ncbi:MAG: hypothetical protein SPH07_02235 [Eubacteriales bacterium]|nr:hypothetical protein [Eubacteriales bacterium]
MTKSKIGQVVSYIVILLVIVAVIGVFAHFTNGFTSDFKTFYVSVDGKDVMISGNGYVISENEPLSVDVKYTFGSFNKNETKDYSVKIIPNKIENSDFTYTVDGESKSFQLETDLTAAFEIDKGEKSFTVKPKGKSLTEVLTAFYGTEVTDCENKGYTDMFTIIVTSYNGEASVKLNFTIAGKVVGVVLDREVIVF